MDEFSATVELSEMDEIYFIRLIKVITIMLEYFNGINPYDNGIWYDNLFTVHGEYEFNSINNIESSDITKFSISYEDVTIDYDIDIGLLGTVDKESVWLNSDNDMIMNLITSFIEGAQQYVVNQIKDGDNTISIKL